LFVGNMLWLGLLFLLQQLAVYGIINV